MGSYLSKVSTIAHQPCRILLHDQPTHPHDLDGTSTPSPNFAVNCPSFTPPTDLHTQLVVVEKDLRDAQLEIARKEVVIHYLLHDKINISGSNDTPENISQKILSLENNIVLLNNDSEHLKRKLREALDIVASLPTLASVSKTPGAMSASSSTCKGSDSENNKQEDLIDLLDSDVDSDNVGAMEGEVALVNRHDDDLTDEEYDGLKSMPGPSHAQSPLLQSPETTYIHHFVIGGDGSRKSKREVELGPQIEHEPRSSKHTAHLLTQSDSSTDSEGSPSEYAWSSSFPVSASPSFGSAPVSEIKSLVTPRDLAELSNSQLTAYAENVWNNITAAYPKARKGEVKPSPSNLGTASSFSASQERHEELSRDPGTSTGLRWAVSEVFDSKAERGEAISINRRNAKLGIKDITFPNLFKYGIRYIPTSSDRGIYRTVVISDIPSGVTMMQLLKKVRGGMVVDVKLLDTIGITGAQSAMVTFLHEHSASAYLDYAKEHCIVFNGVAARVTMVSTPTWPIPFNLQALIDQHGHTRCFEVHNFPLGISASTLKRELTDSPVMKSSSLESMEKLEAGVLSLRFASVRVAGRAAAMFEYTHRYAGCKVKFGPDPCAKPLETLLDGGTVKPGPVSHIALKAEDSFTQEPAVIDSDIVDQTCRLEKVEWDSKPEARWGRGLKSAEQ